MGNRVVEDSCWQGRNRSSRRVPCRNQNDPAGLPPGRRKQHLFSLAAFLLVFLFGAAFLSPLAAQQNVLTWHNNNARTGEDLHETILKPSNVKPATFGKLFVIQVDGKVDARLDQAGDPHGLRGKIAIANAAMAYATFENLLRTDRWSTLADAGARPQRPLWASTSTKDPKYPDVYYVESLIAADTVNTMPPDTLDAYRDHGEPIHRIQFEIDGAPARLEALTGQGIDLSEVTRTLEDEGVKKFAQSYTSLLSGIEAKIGAVAGRQ